MRNIPQSQSALGLCSIAKKRTQSIHLHSPYYMDISKCLEQGIQVHVNTLSRVNIRGCIKHMHRCAILNKAHSREKQNPKLPPNIALNIPANYYQLTGNP